MLCRNHRQYINLREYKLFHRLRKKKLCTRLSKKVVITKKLERIMSNLIHVNTAHYWSIYIVVYQVCVLSIILQNAMVNVNECFTLVLSVLTKIIFQIAVKQAS